MTVSDPTRAKLIETAGRVFAEQGYRAATVREICQQAGANIAAVNYHFRDKLGLYTEVLRQTVCAAHLDRTRAAIFGTNENIPMDNRVCRAVASTQT